MAEGNKQICAHLRKIKLDQEIGKQRWESIAGRLRQQKRVLDSKISSLESDLKRTERGQAATSIIGGFGRLANQPRRGAAAQGLDKTRLAIAIAGIKADLQQAKSERDRVNQKLEAALKEFRNFERNLPQTRADLAKHGCSSKGANLSAIV